MPWLFCLWVSGEKYVLAAHTRDVSGIPQGALMEVGALRKGEYTSDGNQQRDRKRWKE